MTIIPKKFTRDSPVLLCQIWGRRYKCMFGQEVKVFPRNIFLLQNGLVDNYRGLTVNIEINSILLSELENDPDFIRKLTEGYLEKIHRLKEWCVADMDRKQFLDFLELLFDCWQSFFVSLYLPPDERFTKKDFELAMEFRKKTGDLEYDAFNHIDVVLQKLYKNLGPLARYISLEEVTDDKIPSTNVLMQRQKERLIIVDDELVTKNRFTELQRQFDFTLEKEREIVLSKMMEIKGQVACTGRVEGKVRILLRNQDVALLQHGEILISSMTVPTFLPAMEKAAAFVTDEGGITCHAAIVAREMKKPCIIGTKIATKVLKDGDLVEVDADRGIVKILNRKYR